MQPEIYEDFCWWTKAQQVRDEKNDSEEKKCQGGYTHCLFAPLKHKVPESLQSNLSYHLLIHESRMKSFLLLLACSCLFLSVSATVLSVSNHPSQPAQYDDINAAIAAASNGGYHLCAWVSPCI